MSSKQQNKIVFLIYRIVENLTFIYFLFYLHNYYSPRNMSNVTSLFRNGTAKKIQKFRKTKKIRKALKSEIFIFTSTMFKKRKMFLEWFLALTPK